jgi:aryl-alcohol dehydrogenase-like predicted oxidoreductase
MKYNLLANSNLKISQVSFGCMSLGDDHTSNSKLLHNAFGQGINYFDTADIYQNGFNEITVGKAFKEIRQQVVIATKVGNQIKQDGSGLDWNPTKAHILKSINESLKRLQTDYIDLYQLHGGTMEDPIDETIEAFEQLKREGKIRFYGISSIRPAVIQEYVKRSNISSVMMQYSLLDRRPEEMCLDLLRQHNIGVMARGSLTKGLLIDKPTAPFLKYSTEEVDTAAHAVKAVAKKTKRSLVDVVLKFTLHHPAITSAVTGIRNQQQLEDCIRAEKSERLSSEDYQTLNSSISINQYQQ